ncbi:HEAT repeat domain-containing protein [Paenibacillus albicereus]|uniref:HEAT repeat domain-containing protein n=1 Tax=Paenibacillus albicereus TaxID=2726185 RepID=UPI001F2BB3C1|nr:HEAT repeat domain-containing protein [Paenibacillus albicereus]
METKPKPNLNKDELLETEAADPVAELKRAASRSSDWRARQKAASELAALKAPQSAAILRRLLADDPVHPVREAAYRGLVSLGEPAQAPVRKGSVPVKGLDKIVVRVRKSLPEGHAFSDFKEKLRKMRLDVYDVLEGDKGAEFDGWLEEQWKASFERK